MRLLVFKVKTPSSRLDAFIKEKLPPFSEVEISTALVKKLIEGGFVYLNNNLCKICSKKLIKGSRVRIYFDSKSPLQPNLTISDKHILFEDKHLIIINKPTGIATQSTLKKFESNTYDELRYLLQAKGPESFTYLGLLHRLDKPTSGALLFSKTKWVNSILTPLINQNKMNKEYLAITPHQMRPNLSWQVEDQLIRKKMPNRGMVTIDCATGGKKAHTSFEILDSNPQHDLILAKLHTGRTHQIRFHLLKSHLPILGDKIYLSEVTDCRPLLHAYKLSFNYPTANETLIVKAPMPEDMNRLFPRQINK